MERMLMGLLLTGIALAGLACSTTGAATMSKLAKKPLPVAQQLALQPTNNTEFDAVERSQPPGNDLCSITTWQDMPRLRPDENIAASRVDAEIARRRAVLHDAIAKYVGDGVKGTIAFACGNPETARDLLSLVNKTRGLDLERPVLLKFLKAYWATLIPELRSDAWDKQQARRSALRYTARSLQLTSDELVAIGFTPHEAEQISIKLVDGVPTT